LPEESSATSPLPLGDVYDGKKVKSYVNIRGETAKFKKGRTIRIGDDIQDAIADFIEWKKENRQSLNKKAPLFVSQKGGHLTRQALFEIIKKIFKKAGLDQSPHCLRKTGGTIYYIESEYDLIATQKFLGHSDPSTTRRYIGLTTEQIVEYAERLSDHLFAAIRGASGGKFDTSIQMSNFNLTQATIPELIVELQARGIDMTSAIEQMQIQRQPIGEDNKIIPFDRRRKVVR
jgi:hypothetical protein